MSERVLVFGSRDWSDSGSVYERLARFPRHTEVLTGCATGADALARSAAMTLKFWLIDVPCLHEHWDCYGKGAAHMRNDLMLSLSPTQAIGFWDGASPGTASMIAKCQRVDLLLEVVR